MTDDDKIPSNEREGDDRILAQDFPDDEDIVSDV